MWRTSGFFLSAVGRHRGSFSRREPVRGVSWKASKRGVEETPFSYNVHPLRGRLLSRFCGQGNSPREWTALGWYPAMADSESRGRALSPCSHSLHLPLLSPNPPFLTRVLNSDPRGDSCSDLFLLRQGAGHLPSFQDFDFFLCVGKFQKGCRCGLRVPTPISIFELSTVFVMESWRGNPL